jgi:hypothetical protein
MQGFPTVHYCSFTEISRTLAALLPLFWMKSGFSGFHSLDQCLDPVLAELGHSQMRARPLKNGAPGRLKVGPTSGNALAGRFHVGEHESRSAPSSPT